MLYHLISAALASGAGPTLTMSPDAWPVHQKVTAELVFTAGEGGMWPGDYLRVTDPILQGMSWARWSILSTDPADCSPLADEVNAQGSGALITARHDGRPAVRLALARSSSTASLHSMGFTEVTLVDGALREGEQIRLRMGGLHGGEDCGLQTSPRVLEDVPWEGLLWDASEETFSRVGPALVDIYTDKPVEQLFVSAPSQAEVGQPITVRVAALDVFGNPVASWRGEVEVSAEGVDAGAVAAHTFAAEDEGVWAFELTPEDAGVLRVRATADVGLLRGRSNPVRVDTLLPPRGTYFGDIHSHHGHAYVDDAGDYRDQNYEYARDVVGLQVATHSVKSFPTEINGDAVWADLEISCEGYSVDGEFLVLMGFEWLGNWAYAGEMGHHNVYLDACESSRASEVDVTVLSETDADAGLWAWMAELEATEGVRSVSVPHASAYTGHNWDSRDDVARTAAEIWSQWGGSLDFVEPDSGDEQKGVLNALSAGHRMGFIGSSDDHDGWLGNRQATYNTSLGLVGFVATDLSREGIFEALATRSTFATTGHRPLLEFRAHDGGPIAMGEVAVVEAPTFSWSYSGQDRAARASLWAIATSDTGEAPRTLRAWAPSAHDTSGSYEYAWSGAPEAVWLEVVEVGGDTAWSSPIWLTADCSDPDAVDPAGHCAGDSGL